MKRILLKLSGEALAGEKKTGFDEETVRGVAVQVKELVDDGIQVGIVIGGGNFWRGRSSENIDRTKADQIGMLATIMNCIYVSEIFRSVGMMTSVLTPFECGSFTKLFSKDRANKYFSRNMVVFFAGGTGHPYFSTDTTAVLRAVEIGAEAILLAKAVDGVYDSDPKKNPDAVKFDRLSFLDVLNKDLKVMDSTAATLCKDNGIPILVFNLEEPENIVRVLEDFFTVSSRLAGKKVMITAGPTYERIDPVRFIGNFSTGKMGYALADAAARAGADVTVVSGPVSVRPEESSVKVVAVESARQMADSCTEIFPQADIAIMCAAVADYAPAVAYDRKLKRESSESMTLELHRNPDIAAMLGKIKRDDQMLVGFALETDSEEFNARRKMESKNLDMIVLNSLAVPGAGFATDTNAVSVFFADGRPTADIPLMSKADVARNIISLL